MKKFYISALAMALSAGLYAQNPVELKYGSLITAEDAKKHLSIIASDAFEGRENRKTRCNDGCQLFGRAA